MDQIQAKQALSALDENWELVDNSILFQQFIFEDFSEAIEFVNQIAEIATELNHHPNIIIHDFRYVSIETTTHSANDSLTGKDFELAAAIDELFE